MSQLQLVAPPAPPVPDSVDLRCCDVAGLLDEVRGAGLVVADPPWSYSAGSPGNGTSAEHYTCITIDEIAAHVDAAWDCAADDAYLLLWCTWPLLMDPRGWHQHVHAGRWVGKTGGSWVKDGVIGVGYHWRGQAEAALVYVKGKPKPSAMIRSAHITVRSGGKNPGNSGTTHSEKPLPWARDHVRAFCPPGGLVLDLYAGMAPYARAAVAESRGYIGAEIDPDRHARALGLLAGRVGLERRGLWDGPAVPSEPAGLCAGSDMIAMMNGCDPEEDDPWDP